MGVFLMPSLGADMEAGTLVEWMVRPGDRVTRGDAIAVVETQKGAIEIECFEEGIVESLDAALGQELPVGAPLATLRASDQTVGPDTAQPESPPMTAPQRPMPVQTLSAPMPPPSKEPRSSGSLPSQPGVVVPAFAPGQAPPSSPAARVLAAERGLDLGALHGTGPSGAILLADVEVASRDLPAAGRPGSAPPKPGLDMGAMRTAIANAMSRSKREIPHYYLSQTFDLQPAVDYLAALNATRNPDTRLLMGALFVKASARAVAKVAEMNGHYGPDGFFPSTAVHAGIAVALRGGGLIAPAIHDVETLSLDQLMAKMKDLVARVRTGRLRSSELTDGTITISAMGETGADAMAAVIFPPQVAILGIGAPVRRPWITGDVIAPRTTVTFTLSADHRVSDGRRGAKFLSEIGHALQTPEAL